MQVQLRNNTFKATQWFKYGDHPAVEMVEYIGNHYPEQRQVKYQIANNGIYDTCDSAEVKSGDWIVEMFDGIHLYSDEEFKKLFLFPINKACQFCDGTCRVFSCGAKHYCGGDYERI